jgi:hypothetical protein
MAAVICLGPLGAPYSAGIPVWPTGSMSMSGPTLSLPRSPRCTGLLQDLWPTASRWLRLAATRVPNRTPRKPGFPRSLLGSTTVILSSTLETKSADLRQTLRFSKLKLLGDKYSSQVKGVSPALCGTGFCPAAPCGAFEQEP